MLGISNKDSLVLDALKQEEKRQESHIELIASENFVSKEVLFLQGSVLTNKYAEGYPSKRYYDGCEYVDVIENLAIKRICQLFDAGYANVQPHSGSQANMAAIRSLIKPGEKILGMGLNEGGHLTHGYHLSFSGSDYVGVTYGVNKETETIDYEAVRQIALREKPQLIIAGASAYPRAIDFKKFREIADEVGAKLLVDMAHIAGLIAAGLHQNPMPYAHVVTTTTHKTLRGPRGGVILTNDEALSKIINRQVFPGIQGGPLMHVIAAKATAFFEALDDSFNVYQQQVIKNAQTLAKRLETLGYRIVSGGTDNHLLLVDVYHSIGKTGKEAASILSSVNITCNKNTIPYDELKPAITSGIRLGTPAVTSRGLKEEDMVIVANLIDCALRNKDSIENIKKEVVSLMDRFPIYQ
ncbi:Glycine hydroxymethyltransferase [Paracholeplasma brassicae]|uniref:Serine hydroxymethyltransferase n=1 Tax=Acholeplasma brassicae TaxID=61635 RepID=U4KMC5_9MOLU|nr:serine hydroxymethyltransferase [Paracholeplasma brassicae]CCV65225.1 Glycine hydroxymethyltransferase [Paracholeplasma brassicae]